MKRGGGEGAGKVVEQQPGALGNPCSSFSSPSSLLCIRRGFDKNFTAGGAIQGGDMVFYQVFVLSPVPCLETVRGCVSLKKYKSLGKAVELL